MCRRRTDLHAEKSLKSLKTLEETVKTRVPACRPKKTKTKRASPRYPGLDLRVTCAFHKNVRTKRCQRLDDMRRRNGYILKGLQGVQSVSRVASLESCKNKVAQVKWPNVFPRSSGPCKVSQACSVILRVLVFGCTLSWSSSKLAVSGVAVRQGQANSQPRIPSAKHSSWLSSAVKSKCSVVIAVSGGRSDAAAPQNRGPGANVVVRHGGSTQIPFLTSEDLGVNVRCLNGKK